MKCLITILGAGASGKSTLTRALCGSGGKEEVVFYNVEGKAEKAKFVLFPNGAAIAGNLQSTSDSVSSMEARSLLIQDLLKRPDVQFVVTDGVRSSKKWDVDWVQEKLDCAVVYVYLDIPLEENLRRLVARRAAKGKTEMNPKTYENMLAFRERAAFVWKSAIDTYKRQPVKFIKLIEGQTVQDWTREVKRTISQMFDSEDQRAKRAQHFKNSTSY
jgi:hypothetical protein